MSSPLHTALTLPNDRRFLRLARTFVRELAALADLPADQAEALVLAADEACTNTIEHAFEPGQVGTFTVAGELTPDALTVAIQDRGLPFDASLAPTYTPPESQDATQVSTRGMGLYLIRQVADEVQWLNRGPAGKELRLVKHLPQADITQHLPEAELSPFRDDVPPAPEQKYAIRRLHLDEAIQIAQCVYRAYGYTYINEDLYYPERIVRLNETGELISVVAVSETGEVVGHCALERPGLGPVAEMGMAVVSPAHRGRHLMQLMFSFLEEEASRLGLVGLLTQPVTIHAFSQRVIEDFHYRVCGASLGLGPGDVTFKQIRTGPLPQRESLLLCFKYLGPPPPAIVHAPARHREMLERIYGHLGAPAEFRPPGTSEGPGQLAVSFNRTLGLGMIAVQRVGTDTPAAISRARHDLCDITGAQAVYLELPLAQVGTPTICQAAEAEGFFFSGLGPRFAPDGDTLRLQYLHTDRDTARLQVVNSFGQELLAYVAGERERVRQLTD